MKVRVLVLPLLLTACSGAQAPAAQAPAPQAAQAPHGEGYHKDFSDTQAYAAQFDSPDRDAWQNPDDVIRNLELRPGMVVADVGAGTGYFLGRLSAAVGPTGHVLALDVEPKMVEHMTQRAQASSWTNVEPKLVAPQDPGLAPESVDRVLVVNTWHHIDSRAEYSAKLYRALRPGGIVVVVEFNRDSDIGPPMHHRQTPEEVRSELTAGGFSAEIVEEGMIKQYLVSGIKR